MTKRFVSVLLVLCLIFGAVPASAADVVPEGWTPVYTLQDLQNCAQKGAGQKMILMNNIDADQEDILLSFSRRSQAFYCLYENSIFDGNGHTIYNLKGCVAEINKGTIRNLNVTIHDIKEDKTHQIPATSGDLLYAGLVNNNEVDGLVENCNVKMTIHRDMKEEDIHGYITVSGLAQNNYGTIRNCIVDMDVDVRSSCAGGGKVNAVRLAGLCGNTSDYGTIGFGTIDHCLVTGSLQGTGNLYSCSALGLTSLGSSSKCVNSACALELLALTTNNEYYFSPAFQTWTGSVDNVENCRVVSDIQLIHNVPENEKHEFINIGYTEDSRANILADWDLTSMPGDTPQGIPTPSPSPSPSPSPDPAPSTTIPADAEASGTCGAQGDNLVWWVKDNTLTISGTGEMEDYDFSGGKITPWIKHTNVIGKIVVTDGVTSVGKSAFTQLRLANEITLGSDVDHIGRGALASNPLGTCTVRFKGGAPRWIDAAAFSQHTEAYINYSVDLEKSSWWKWVSQTYYTFDQGAADQILKNKENPVRWVQNRNKKPGQGDLYTSNTWCFANTSANWGDEKPGYYITQSDYDRLLSFVSSSEKKRLTKGSSVNPNTDWAKKTNFNVDGKGKTGQYEEHWGSCYGMSATVAAVINGALPCTAMPGAPTSLFSVDGQVRESGATNTIISKSTQSFINFYHMQQNLKAVQDAKCFVGNWMNQPTQLLMLDSMVRRAEENNKVVLIDFDMKHNGGQTGHTVVGYGVEDGYFPMTLNGSAYAFIHRVLLYDPVLMGDKQNTYEVSLYYNDSTWAIPGWGDGPADAHAVSTTSGINISDPANCAQLTGLLDDDSYINAIDYRSGARSYTTKGRSATDNIPGYIYTNSPNLTLTINGKTETIRAGLFDGDTTISASGAQILFPKAGDGNGSYTIVIPESQECNVSSTEGFSCSLETDDHYLSVATEGAGTAKFTVAGTVDLNLDAPSPAYLSLTANDSPAWHNYEFTSENSTQLSLELTEDGLLVNGDGLDDANVTAYDSEDESQTLDVSTKKDSVLVTGRDSETAVFIDTDGDGRYETPVSTTKPTPTPTSSPSPNPSDPTTVGGFTDVKSGDYFADAVVWAVKSGITNGTGIGIFSPNTTCTRGQIVTFLWRAADQPEPNTPNNPFKDVKSSDYFYKAVLWAVENKITTGTTSTTFNPGGECSRDQAVTFMWRAAGELKPKSTNNPFSDVKTGAYYYDAVLWAVEKGITTGTTSTTFSPSAKCTRGQIVTFLYRGRDET